MRFLGAPATAPFASALVFFRPSDKALRMRYGTLVDLLGLQPSFL